MSTYFRALAKLAEGFREEDNQRLQAINRELEIHSIPTVTMVQYDIIAKHFRPKQTADSWRGIATPSADDPGVTARDLKPGV